MARDELQDQLTDIELRKASLSLRHRAQSGEPLNHLLVEAFALVRQAAYRALGLRHFEVQLMGGIAMHEGMIAVMQTGEGKTLTATLPLYLAALTGTGTHLATANDYLAERDAKLMQPLFDTLGMTVGVVTAASSKIDRISAYQCDVTYSTAKEIGFDFLRDRLHKRREDEGVIDVMAALLAPNGSSNPQMVQRDLHFVVVDEADSILIDEAKTPLIISSLPTNDEQARVALFGWSARNVKEFIKDKDFEYDVAKRTTRLTPAGRHRVRRLEKPDAMSKLPMLDIYAQVEMALLVDQQFVRDRHYIVRDGEIVIVDEFTGRLAEGRKWRSGLHQAIEAREEVEITFETNEAARITVQDLFMRYDRVCGMTGTIANSGREIKKIYKIGTVPIPTNKRPCRERWPDKIFYTETEKWHAIANDVAELHRLGRPVLIGTRSIDKSELLSHLLIQRGIKHELLNARQLPREAEIIAKAGLPERVTVSTNMAGRGTDIQLDEHARRLGGLHVICSEVHESARIDRQLVGRCGRQGDPGSFQFYMSLEDDILVQAFGPKYMQRLQRTKSAGLLTKVCPVFFRAQQKIEYRNFRSRRSLLDHERRRQLAQREMGQDPYVDTIV